MVSLKKVVSFLDSELRIGDFHDDSNNGLQVESTGSISYICAGVDASLEFFIKAAEKGADLLICHHGISWGDSLKRITGMNYKRLKFLMDRDIALYACHLPLDAHPQMGNNILICRALGLENVKPFGSSYGVALGFSGNLPEEMPYTEFKELVSSIFGHTPSSMDFGKEKVRSVAVISGGGCSEIMEAGESGIDLFLSGEPKLTAYHIAQEYCMNAVFAGHYATEVFGVKALAALLAKEFSVNTEFLDMKISF